MPAKLNNISNERPSDLEASRLLPEKKRKNVSNKDAARETGYAGTILLPKNWFKSKINESKSAHNVEIPERLINHINDVATRCIIVNIGDAFRVLEKITSTDKLTNKYKDIVVELINKEDACKIDGLSRVQVIKKTIEKVVNNSTASTETIDYFRHVLSHSEHLKRLYVDAIKLDEVISHQKGIMFNEPSFKKAISRLKSKIAEQPSMTPRMSPIQNIASGSPACPSNLENQVNVVVPHIEEKINEQTPIIPDLNDDENAAITLLMSLR